jgi:FAD/FMN-containing dehydrogenase
VMEISDFESEAHARERFEHVMELALEQAIITDAVVAENMVQAHALWHVRESIPLAQAQEGLNIKHDISIAVSRIPEFVRQTDALLQKEIPGVRLVNFGHLGDGNLHYNVQCPEGQSAKEFLQTQEARINHLVYGQVHEFGGSISAEHGIGSLKRDELPHYKSPVALTMMRQIKAALDPKGLMNPDRML